MNKKKLVTIIKWVWLILVLVLAVFYVKNNFQEIKGYLFEISIIKISISFLLILIGKFLLTGIIVWVLEGENWNIPFMEMFRIYSITQLGKYIPGGIWHFIGRAGIYRSRGMGNKQITKVLIIENILLFASAVFSGFFIALILNFSPLLERAGIICSEKVYLIFALILLIAWFVLLWGVRRFFHNDENNRLINLFLFQMMQIFIWVILGMSLWVLFPGKDTLLLGPSISGFSLSWAIGYISVFAPGGLGIREVSLVTILAFKLPQESILTFSAVHRLIWVIAEIFLGLLFGFGGENVNSNQIDKESR